MLNELSNAVKVVGLKQSRKLIRENAVKKAFIAMDAEEHITRSLLELCRESGVEVETVATMAELGAACGIEVGAAVAVIPKQPKQ